MPVHLQPQGGGRTLLKLLLALFLGDWELNVFGINLLFVFFIVVYHSWLLYLAEDLSASRSCQELVNIGVAVFDSAQQPVIAKWYWSALGKITGYDYMIMTVLTTTCISVPLKFFISHCFNISDFLITLVLFTNSENNAPVHNPACFTKCSRLTGTFSQFYASRFL